MDESLEMDAGSRLSTARTSSILGIAALTMLGSMCCTSVMGIFGGTIVGLIGLWMAYTQHYEELGPASRAYNNVGLATGGIASGMGCMFTLAIVAYISLYMVMFALIILAEM